MGRRRLGRPQGLAALEGKPLVSWKELHEATGLTIGTLKRYKQINNMPQPDGDYPNTWLTNRKDLQEWVQKQATEGVTK